MVLQTCIYHAWLYVILGIWSGPHTCETSLLSRDMSSQPDVVILIWNEELQVDRPVYNKMCISRALELKPNDFLAHYLDYLHYQLLIRNDKVVNPKEKYSCLHKQWHLWNTRFSLSHSLLTQNTLPEEAREEPVWKCWLRMSEVKAGQIETLIQRLAQKVKLLLPILTAQETLKCCLQVSPFLPLRLVRPAGLW